MLIPLNQIALPEHDQRFTVDDDHIDELADSMRDRGLLQAIGVKCVGDGMFEVVFGASRLRAAQLLHWSEIRAEILPDIDDANHEANKLIENVQRKNLSPIEEADGLMQLVGDAEPNIRDLQRQTGKSRSWVISRLELYTLPNDLRKAVQAGLISAGVAVEFGNVTNQDVRTYLLGWAVENGCTVTQARGWVQNSSSIEVGTTTMNEFQDEMQANGHEVQFVKPRFNCFGCRNPYDFNQINQLVICGHCQQQLVDFRNATATSRA